MNSRVAEEAGETWKVGVAQTTHEIRLITVQQIA